MLPAHDSTRQESHHKPRRIDPAPAGRPAGKVVVAAESPWAGELYRTSGGNPRLRFGSAETFCRAFLTTTGWALRLVSTQPDPPQDAGGRTPGSGSSAAAPATQKFIVATTAPWTGQIYLTRPGLGRFEFTTFEGFLSAVLAVTGWQLGTAVQPALSRPGAIR